MTGRSSATNCLRCTVQTVDHATRRGTLTRTAPWCSADRVSIRLVATRPPMSCSELLRRSVQLGLGVAGDEGVHHVERGHLAVDDSVDRLGDGGVDAHAAGELQQGLAGL